LCIWRQPINVGLLFALLLAEPSGALCASANSFSRAALWSPEPIDVAVDADLDEVGGIGSEVLQDRIQNAIEVELRRAGIKVHDHGDSAGKGGLVALKITVMCSKDVCFGDFRIEFSNFAMLLNLGKHTLPEKFTTQDLFMYPEVWHHEMVLKADGSTIMRLGNEAIRDLELQFVNDFQKANPWRFLRSSRSLCII
jgi:hypothetical protein